MDKALLLVLFPFFTIILLVGFVTFYVRHGRPVSMKLKGMGITFELRGSDQPSKENAP